MKPLNFEKVIQQVENGKMIEMLAYKNFHCDWNFDLLYCKQGHRYIFAMKKGYYSILKLTEDSSQPIETVVVFEQERYKNAGRADLKRYIEEHFCEPLQGELFVEIKKVVKGTDDIDNINRGLRTLHKQHEFSISDRSNMDFSNGEKVDCIVGRIDASKLSVICEIFNELDMVDEQISESGYTISLDVDIAEYDFYQNGR